MFSLTLVGVKLEKCVLISNTRASTSSSPVLQPVLAGETLARMKLVGETRISPLKKSKGACEVIVFPTKMQAKGFPSEISTLKLGYF